MKSSEQPKPTIYKRVTHAETAKMVRLRGEDMSISAIAGALNRSTETVHRILREYEPTVALARAKLEAGAEDAAEAWRRAIETAADAGRHAGARELLEAIGVVQREQQAPLVGVIVHSPEGSYDSTTGRFTAGRPTELPAELQGPPPSDEESPE